MSKGRRGSRSRPGWMTRFLAVVRYEVLWNIRKKKFLGMIIVAFALATLTLASGYIVSAVTGQPVDPKPDFVINSNLGLGGIGFLLFAIVTVMNSVSGEFESGTIVPLLAKPVSRTTVFIGKLFAAFLTLLTTYVFLTVYLSIGGVIIYGPQNNLHLVPLSLIGGTISTLVWIAIVLLFGSLSKSSMIAALGTIGVWLGATIIGSILGVLSGQGWILTYVPGSGTSGFVEGTVPASPLLRGAGVATGTDNIGPNLINYILHPDWNVTFYKFNFTNPMNLLGEPLYSLPLSSVVMQSIVVASIYFVVLTAVAWYVFKRTQVTV